MLLAEFWFLAIIKFWLLLEIGHESIATIYEREFFSRNLKKHVESLSVHDFVSDHVSQSMSTKQNS